MLFNSAVVRLFLKSVASIILGPLLLDSTSFVQGVPSSGNILGATAGSTISGSGLPTGFSINSAAATWSYDGSAGASGTMLLTEVLGGLQNATAIDYTVSAGVPANVNLPTINGTDQEGVQLFCDVGDATVDWTNNPTSFAYQWQLNNANVGTNSPFYTPPLGSRNKTGTCIVTPSNGAGAGAPVTAGPTGTILAAIAPKFQTAPSLSFFQGDSSTPYAVGNTLVASGEAWTGSNPATLAFTFKRNAAAIPNATNQTSRYYVVQVGDNGDNLTVTQTITNVAGTDSATSAAVGPVTLNSPLIDYTVPVPTLTVTNAQTTFPPVLSVNLPAAFKTDTHNLQILADDDFAFGSPLFNDTLTISDTEETNHHKVVGDLGLDTTGAKYFKARLLFTVAGTPYGSQWAPIVGHGNATAPTINSAGIASAYHVNEGTPLNLPLTVTDARPIKKWSIVAGGIDRAQFQAVNAVLQFTGTNGRSASNGLALMGGVAGNTNSYAVTVQCTDYFNNTATATLTITVDAVDSSPDPISFGSTVTGVAQSTDFTSPAVTLTGVTANYAIPLTVSDGKYRISHDSGVTWSAFATDPGGLSMVLNDQLEVQAHSAGAQLIGTTVAVTLGDKSASYTVITSGTLDPSTLFGPSDQGYAYDFKDATKIYQSVAGSGTQGVAGQPVGKLLDLSGKSNPLVAAADNATRPTYNTTYVSFDGVNDFMANAIAPLYAAAKAAGYATLIAYVRANSGQLGAAFILEGSGTSGNPKYQMFASAQAASSTGYHLFVRDDANATKLGYNGTAVTPCDGNWHVIVVTDDGTNMLMTVDGVAGTAQPYTHDTITLTHTGFGGQNNAAAGILGTASYSKFDVARAFGINRQLTTTEKSNVTAWVSS